MVQLSIETVPVPLGRVCPLGPSGGPPVGMEQSDSGPTRAPAPQWRLSLPAMLGGAVGFKRSCPRVLCRQSAIRQGRFNQADGDALPTESSRCWTPVLTSPRGEGPLTTYLPSPQALLGVCTHDLLGTHNSQPCISWRGTLGFTSLSTQRG